MLSMLYKRRNRDSDGFTLIELLVVVIIIGILAAIALPIFIDQTKTSVDASVKSDVRNTVTNVTNMQAQKSVTGFKVASSGSNTVEVRTPSALYASNTSSPTTPLDLGAEYTVQGYNAGGKAYQGPDGNGKAFTFTSTTGQFTTEGAASTPSNYTATAGSSSYSGSTLTLNSDMVANGTNDNGSDIYFLNSPQYGSNAAASVARTITTIVAGSVDPKAPSYTFNCPAYKNYADYSAYTADGGSAKYFLSTSVPVTDVKVYDASGARLPFTQSTTIDSKIKISAACPYSINDPNATGAIFLYENYELSIVPATAEKAAIKNNAKRVEFAYGGSAHTFAVNG